MKRNVRVFISCGEKAGPMHKSLQRVLKTCADIEFVDDKETADLVITDNVREIIAGYSEKKQYAFFNLEHQPIATDKKNVVMVPISTCLATLAELIAKIQEQDDGETTIAAVKVEVSPEKPEAPWILVVDDKPENRVAAQQQLGKEFNVILAEGFNQARKALSERRFDYALLDLHLPVDTEGALGENTLAKWLGQDVPYGIFLLLEACQKGADSAVVTDLNHHQDPFSAAIDFYSGKTFRINGQKAMLLHAHMENGVKNWIAALAVLMR